MLMKRFTIEPILVTSDLDKKMRIEVDILGYITEGVLFMKCTNKKRKLVVYLSKLLNKIKHNY